MLLRAVSAVLTLALPLAGLAQAPAGPAPAAARGADVDRGLLAYYALDGDAVDAVTRARAQAVGVFPADGRDGRRGGALAFDGTRSFVSLGDALEPARFTISAWIRPDVNDRSMAIVSKVKNLPGHWERNLELRVEPGGRLLLHVPSGRAWDQVQGTRPIAPGRWTHVAAVYDGARAQLYVDGVRDGAPLAAAYAQSRTDVYVGARPEGGGRDGRTPTGPTFFFAGAIDELRIHDRPLADAEIAQLAQDRGAPPAPPRAAFPPPGPARADEIARFPLDGDARDAAGGPAGVLAGDARPAEDRGGDPRGALAFAGRGQVDLGARTEPEVLSIAAWVRPSRVDRDGVILSKLSTVPSSRSRVLELRVDAGGRVALELPGGARPQVVRSTRPIAAGRWVHVAATFDGARAVLFLDGAPDAAADFAPFDASRGPAFLGARPDAGGKRAKLGTGLDGRLDDVRLFRGALTEREVRELADPRAGRPGGGRDDDRDRDDAEPLVGVGRLLVAYDGAVAARDARGLVRVEQRVLDGLGRLEDELRSARAGKAVLQQLRRAIGEFEAARGRVDALSLDRKRSALAGVSDALWDDLAHDLDERPLG
jgi:hypothetical protein